MPVAPTGTRSKVLDNARTLIANSTTFQTWVSAIDAAAAKASIHIRGLDAVEDLTATGVRPYCILAPSGTDRRTQIAEGVFRADGLIRVFFEAAVHADNQASHEAAYFAFQNVIGAIITECLNLAGTNEYLMVMRFDQVDDPERAAPDDYETLGDYYSEEAEIEWWGLGN